ncbi:MAG: hypothetical protein K6A43_02380 [Treponema sp.]|nr:hypothetical protein [Treponema sp.]
MKKSFAAISILFALCSAFIFADESSNLSYNITTDFAYYPKSNYIAGDTHFAPLTGTYSGLEGRVTGNLNYTIPTPLGSHWLLNSANLVLNAALELTPVSVKPGVSVKFTPLPFIVFEGGAQAGTGWNLAGLQGMAIFDPIHQTYTDLDAFKNWFLKWYAQGVFQFDTGAIISGDWTHIQLMYTYQVYYEQITGVENGNVWMWQCANNRANGLMNYQSLILAYQMPLVLSRIGFVFECDGHYNNSDYKAIYINPNYNGSFKKINISPMAQLSLSQHDTLSFLLGFSSRRSFTINHEDSNVEPFLSYAGREWFFNRIALSWSHNF